MNHSIRDEVHRWADECTHWKMDEQVLCSNPDLDRLLREFGSGGSSTGVFMDISLEAVVGLQRQVGRVGSTWRQSAKELHCENWTVKAYEYLDSEMGDRPFPTSTTPLEAACFGGAVFIYNGAHRTIAGLVRAFGLGRVDPRFKAVRCELHPMQGGVLDWALHLWEKGGLEWYDSHQAPAADAVQRDGCGRAFHLLFRGTSNPEQWFGIDRVRGEPYGLPMRALRKADRNGYMKDMAERFAPVPAQVLRAWRSRAWAETVLR